MISNTVFPPPCFPLVVAFLVAYHQNKQLIGEKGLLPCELYLQNVKKYFKGKINLDALSYAPTIIWFLDWSDMDSTLDYLSLFGLATSAFVLVTGCANMVLMAVLWVLYLSLVNGNLEDLHNNYFLFHFSCVGTTGWESQLLETGFLGIFLCPLWTLSRLPRHTPPSSIIIWSFRWLIFRIMLGAVSGTSPFCFFEVTAKEVSHPSRKPAPDPTHWSPLEMLRALVCRIFQLIIGIYFKEDKHGSNNICVGMLVLLL
uniref:Lipase maturation factor n=1 Tax=Strix occidentalis caurina TaxID=311401 RepID=A0A8D0FFQ9_STROC